MADYEARIAPFINEIFYVTSIFGEERASGVLHKGIDIATPSAGGGANLYSMCNGTVVNVTNQPSGFGHYMIMKDAVTGMGFLYAHMKERTPLNVGDSVSIGQYVGFEGTSGSSTGIHLHLEMQDISNNDWIFGAPLSTYNNPADFMGFPNVEGISVIYDGEPIPPTQFIKNEFPWVLYAKKLRIKRY